MSRFTPTKRRRSMLGVLALVAANAAVVIALTGVSYASTDTMMHDYSSSSMSMDSDS